MFLHLGKNVVVCKSDIVAILDIKSTLSSKVSREFLEMCEEEGFADKVINDKLRSLVIVGTVKNRTVYKIKIYYSPISALTLQKRANFME
ncbi:MAG TPA: DUF370 domain-containing protein [Clostridia bacterium]|nr:DUF370 domain-containing protein [Clostridia bacterium]